MTCTRAFAVAMSVTRPRAGAGTAARACTASRARAAARAFACTACRRGRRGAARRRARRRAGRGRRHRVGSLYGRRLRYDRLCLRLRLLHRLHTLCHFFRLQRLRKGSRAAAPAFMPAALAEVRSREIDDIRLLLFLRDDFCQTDGKEYGDDNVKQGGSNVRFFP